MSREFNDNVIAEFRANDGHVGGDLAGTPIILIHHLGARTRTERVTPLAFSAQGDGRLVIAASNGGSPTHPTNPAVHSDEMCSRGRGRSLHAVVGVL
jgi:F420H(2)-dependent quinone reductase